MCMQPHRGLFFNIWFQKHMLHKAEATSAVTDFLVLPFKPTHPPRSSLLTKGCCFAVQFVFLYATPCLFCYFSSFDAQFLIKKPKFLINNILPPQQPVDILRYMHERSVSINIPGLVLSNPFLF